MFSLPPEARYAALSPGEQREAEDASRVLADEVYDGLDLRAEIRSAAARSLGDTLLLWEGSGRLARFVVCHWGRPAKPVTAAC